MNSHGLPVLVERRYRKLHHGWSIESLLPDGKML